MVAGCPLMITCGTMVGEPEGVEIVEEAGDAASSTDGDRTAVEIDSSGFAIEDDDGL